MTISHIEASELLGAYALDAVEPIQHEAVTSHLDTCVVCAAEAGRLADAAGWLGATEALPPPRSLRPRVVDAVRRVGVVSPAEAHAAAIARLTVLLHGLDEGDFARMAIADYGWTVHDLVAHLAAIEALLARRLGVDGARFPDTEDDWDERTTASIARHRRRPAREAVAELVSAATIVRDRLASLPRSSFDEARLAWVGVEMSVGSAVTARAFELWIHADDIRAALARPLRAPDAGEMRLLTDMAVRSLPAGLTLRGWARPGASARVELTGPGGGSWTIPLAYDEPMPGSVEPDVCLTADAVAFCRLTGERLAPSALAVDVEGDHELVSLLLHAASAFAQA